MPVLVWSTETPSSSNIQNYMKKSRDLAPVKSLSLTILHLQYEPNVHEITVKKVASKPGQNFRKILSHHSLVNVFKMTLN